MFGGQRVSFLDPEGNPISLELTQNQTFRQIASSMFRFKIQDLPHTYPFEELLLFDLTQKRLVSKYAKLENNRQYKLLLAHKIFLRCVNAETLTETQSEKIQILEQQICQLEIKLKNYNELSQRCAEYENLVQSQTATIKELRSEVSRFEKNSKKADLAKNNLLEIKSLYDVQAKKNEILSQDLKEVEKKSYQFEVRFNILEKENKKLSDQILTLQEEQALKKTHWKKKLEVIKEQCQKLQQQKDEQMQQMYQEIIFRTSAINIPLRQQVEENQNQQLKDKISALEMELKDSKKNYEQKLSQQKAQSQQEISNMESQYKEEATIMQQQLDNSKIKQQDQIRNIQSLEDCRQQSLHQISEMDATILRQNNRISEFENSKLETIYRNRITRIVEISEKPHIVEINFAIEQLYNLMRKNQIENQQWIQDQFTVYELTLNETVLDKKKVVKFYEKIYEPSDLDFLSEVILKEMKQIKGKYQTKLITSNSDSYDEIYLFQCQEQVLDISKDQKLALRLVKNPHNEEGSKESAVNETMGLLIAQNLLETFYKELGQIINAPRGFKFQKPYIISKKESFKTYFMNTLKTMRNYESKYISQIIQMFDDHQANLFFNSIRDAQFSREVKNKIGSLDMLKDCIQKCCQNQMQRQQIQSQVQNFIPQGIEKEFFDFLQILNDVHQIQFPIEKFYTAYTICPLEDYSFTKYNGGRLQFDNSDEGKFFSAFSYYTIKKSHRQVCVSHIQGVGKQLYDPLVSTYDGLLGKLDQGFNEIKTIMSKFETARAQDIGEKYLYLVGITKEKQQQRQIIG